MKNIPQNIIAMFWLSSVLLAPNMACLVESAITKSSEHSEIPLSMCPSEGANLYLKCADGREKVIGLGYKPEPFYVRQKGKWAQEVEGFCEEGPAEIKFYFGKSHLRVDRERANRTKVINTWQSAPSECALYNASDLPDFVTLKITSLPITDTDPI